VASAVAQAVSIAEGASGAVVLTAASAAVVLTPTGTNGAVVVTGALAAVVHVAAGASVGAACESSSTAYWLVRAI
jgi:hypothetical protein